MKVFVFQSFITLVTVLFLPNVIQTEEQPELKAVIQGNEKFTKNIYTALASEKSNIFFSPISIHTILSLLYQGARGNTQATLAKVLNVPDTEKTAAGYKDALTRLNSIENVTLLMANKVFLNNHYKLQEGFRNVAVQSFNSEVELLDFKRIVESADTINAWVEKKTNNKIKEAIDPASIGEDTSSVLVNVIYFKSKWAIPFKTKNTKTEKFYINENNTTKVEMMHLSEKLLYADVPDLDAQVLKLYYTTEDANLLVILPKKRNGIVNLEKKFASLDFTTVFDEVFLERRVNLALPKFKIKQTIDLRDPLTKIGVGDIFSARYANLTGMIKTLDSLYVSNAVHKAYMELNEEGTEAAAYTEITIMRGSAIEITPPVDFIADHPFLIVLQSKKLSSFKEDVLQEGDTLANILFVGRISEPHY